MARSLAPLDLSVLQGAMRRLLLDERCALPPMRGFAFPGEAHLTLHIDRVDHDLALNGELVFTITGICDRCLEEFAARRTLSIDEHLDLDTVGDPFGEANVIHDGALDLEDFVRQLVGTDLPLVSLCRPDCAGLCPTCGTNRNDAPCGCTTVTKGDHGEPEMEDPSLEDTEPSRS